MAGSVTGVRRLLLDEAPGERRGVVLLDGRPERLLIAREGEPPAAELGARYVGRVGVRAGRRVFVQLPHGPDGVASAPEPAPEGAAVEVEVVAEARDGKGPRLTLLEPAEGAPRLIAAAPDLPDRLRGFAPGVAVETGREAEAAADLAEETALARSHAFRGGLTVHVESTRALTAVDVDLAAGEGAGEPRIKEANLSALRHAARLLRLKGLGGLVAIDLVGFPRPDLRGLYRAEAERAFAGDPGVVVAPPDRFGLVIVSRPHRERGAAARLCDPEGRPTARTMAQRLLRDLRRELRVDPGAPLVAVGPPEVVAALRPWLPPGRVGLREVACDREAAHIGRA